MPAAGGSYEFRLYPERRLCARGDEPRDDRGGRRLPS